jgi:hypothetical protein
VVQVPKNVADILNGNAKKWDRDEINFENLSEKLRQQLYKDGSDKVTVSSHCELIIASHVRRTRKKSGEVELGVSKHCCWLCQNYFESLRRRERLHILVSGNHGKIHAGWDMPPDTPSTVAVDMRDLIESEIHEFRESVIARRRSDSFPIENTYLSGDEDEDLVGIDLVGELGDQI